MKKKINGEEVFTSNSNSIAIAPTTNGYILSYSADGKNWTDKQTVPANENCVITGVVPNMYFRLLGNTDTITVLV